MKVKVMYWAAHPTHARVFRSIPEDNRFEQAIITQPGNQETKIKNVVLYNNKSEIFKIIEKFNPHIVIQSNSDRLLVDFLKSKNICSGYTTHGVWPMSHENIEIVKDPFFKKFDFFFCPSSMFEHIMKTYNSPDAKVFKNIFLQADALIAKSKQRDAIRKKILNTHKCAEDAKIITLFGHKMSKKSDKLLPYNYAYFESMIMLSQISKKHNWLVLVKPKFDGDREFLLANRKKWGAINNLYDRFNALRQHSRFKILPANADAYDHYMSDVIICSARSTIEVEAAMINAPIARLFAPTSKPTPRQLSYEYGAIENGAVEVINDLKNMEHVIKLLLQDPQRLNKNQNNYIKTLGIVPDGKSYERLLDRLHILFGRD